MTESKYSERFEREISYLVLPNLPVNADQSLRFLALLSALADEHAILGDIRGELFFATSSEGTPPPGPWALPRATPAAPALLEFIASQAMSPIPLKAKLVCEPVVYIADDWIEVVDYDYDDEDLWGLGRLSLVPASGLPPRDGLRAFRIVAGPEKSPDEPLISFSVTFGPPPSTDGFAAFVRSKFDLWSSVGFDMNPNLPHGPTNARLLADCIARVATALGAPFQQIAPL